MALNEDGRELLLFVYLAFNLLFLFDSIHHLWMLEFVSWNRIYQSNVAIFLRDVIVSSFSLVISAESQLDMINRRLDCWLFEEHVTEIFMILMLVLVLFVRLCFCWEHLYWFTLLNSRYLLLIACRLKCIFWWLVYFYFYVNLRHSVVCHEESHHIWVVWSRFLF
jgi:hypothetical protein